MRPHHARTITAMFGIALLVVLTLSIDGLGPTGRAVDTFSAGVTVIGVTVNTTNTTQAQRPTVGGGSVNFSIPITYSGTGTATITIAKPTNYEGGYGWVVVEDGTPVTVTDTGPNLQWTADLDATTVILRFLALPPAVTLVNSETAGSAQNRTVRVSADVHYTNVLASATLDSSAQNVTLLENGTFIDRTTDYNLTVTGGVATWGGFNLSSQTFLFVTTVTPSADVSTPAPSGGSTHTQRLVPWEWTAAAPDEIAQGPRFALAPLTAMIDLESPGATSTIAFTLTNLVDEPVTVRLRSTTSFASVPEGPYTILPGESQTVQASLIARRTGVQETRIIADDGIAPQQAFLEIRVPEPEPSAAPADAQAPTTPIEEAPAPSLRWRSWWTDALLLFGVAILGVLAAFWRRRSRPPIAVQSPAV